MKPCLGKKCRGHVCPACRRIWFNKMPVCRMPRRKLCAECEKSGAT